jgi:hypothetical protein
MDSRISFLPHNATLCSQAVCCYEHCACACHVLCCLQSSFVFEFLPSVGFTCDAVSTPGFLQQSCKAKGLEVHAVVTSLSALAPTSFPPHLHLANCCPAGDRPLQLVAARDVGLAAATALTSSNPGDWAGQRLPLAGDQLTPLQMCEEFSAAQGGMPIKHSCPPAWLFWFLSR